MSDPKSINPVSKILRKGRLIVCAGPGGVGKTTTSAALALQAALKGRRVIVLTIDPARRLANSLGIDELTNDPQQIDISAHLDEDTAEGGELWAMMLDQEKTLDDLVARFAPDAATVERSKKNNIYRLLSSALHGMQEYMALDKLHDLYTSRDYDLVVLDTPPTKDALVFLATPSRASTFFDERIVKLLLPAKKTGSRIFGRVMGANVVVLGLLGKLFGTRFVEELSEFFETLYFLQDALRSRGEMIEFILRDPDTSFLIITSADARRIKEAVYFHEKLAELDQEASAFVLNRVIPSFTLDDLEDLDPAALTELAAANGVRPERVEALDEALRAQYAHLAKLAAHNRDVIARLEKRVGPDLIRTVPMLGADVHDLGQLRHIGSFLA